jgi:hypothetical protein
MINRINVRCIAILATIVLSMWGCAPREVQSYERAKAVNTIECYEQYLSEYPKGEYSDTVRTLLIELRASHQAKVMEQNHKSIEILRSYEPVDSTITLLTFMETWSRSDIYEGDYGIISVFKNMGVVTVNIGYVDELRYPLHFTQDEKLFFTTADRQSCLSDSLLEFTFVITNSLDGSLPSGLYLNHMSQSDMNCSWRIVGNPESDRIKTGRAFFGYENTNIKDIRLVCSMIFQNGILVDMKRL